MDLEGKFFREKKFDRESRINGRDSRSAMEFAGKEQGVCKKCFWRFDLGGFAGQPASMAQKEAVNSDLHCEGHLFCLTVRSYVSG